MLGTEFDYFLLIADEMNITSAARKAFVSQQCMSKYLKRLEEKIGSPLFVRKPYFALTPTGQLVLQKARAIRALYQNMDAELQEIKGNNIGTLRFGLSVGRALQLLPNIFPSFHSCYPNIYLNTEFGMTEDLCIQVGNGNLDFLLGLSIPEEKYRIKLIPLAKERITLAISDNLLIRYFPKEYPQCKYSFLSGIDIHNFVNIPFLRNPSVSRTAKIIEHYCQDESIKLHYIATINSNMTQLTLAAKDCGACFFPEFLTSYGNWLNQNSGKLQHLNFFPIKNLKTVSQISLGYLEDKHLMEYEKYFINLIQQAFLNFPSTDFFNNMG